MSPLIAALLGAGVAATVCLTLPVLFRGTVRRTARPRGHEPSGDVPNLADQLLASSTDGILAFDQDLRYTVWSPGMERISGVAARDVLGRPADEAFPFLEEIGELEYFRAALRGETVRSGDRPFQVPATGRSGYFEGQYGPLFAPDGAIMGGFAVVRDITERRRTAHSLVAVEHRFRLLVESVQDYAICLLDTEGRVSSWNRGAERIKGYAEAEALGTHFRQFYTERDRASGLPEENLRRALTEEECVDEGWRVRKDGNRFWARASIRPVRDEHGRHVGFSKVTRDLTDQKHQQDVIDALLRIGPALNAVMDLDVLLDRLVIEALALTGATQGCSGLRTPQGLTCRRYCRDRRFEDLEYTWPPGHGLPGRLLRDRVPYVTNRAGSDPHTVPEPFAAFGVESALSVPVLSPDGEVTAFFEVHNKPGGFGALDVRSVRSLADSAAVAVANAVAWTRLGDMQDMREREHRLAGMVRDVAVAANEAETPDAALERALEIVCRAGGWTVGHAFTVAGEAPTRAVASPVWHEEDPDRTRVFRDASGDIQFETGAGLPGRVLATRSPEWEEDLGSAAFRRSEAAAVAGLRSGFAVPVVVRDDIVAVLEFYGADHRTVEGDLLDAARSVGTILGRVFERARAHAGIEAARSRFERFFHANPLPTALTRIADASFVEVNAAFLDAVGLERDAVVGRTAGEIGFWEDPEDRTILLDALARDGRIDGFHARLNVSGQPRDVVATLHAVDLDGEAHILGAFVDISERVRAEQALRVVAEGVSSETGEGFFHALTGRLQAALGLDWVIIAEVLEGDAEHVRTKSMCFRATIKDNMTYALAGTPCENIVDKHLSAYAANVAELFPTDTMLTEFGIESYVGVPLFDSLRRPLGLLSVMHSAPLTDVERIGSVLTIFAARAGAELERQRAERALALHATEQAAVAELSREALRGSGLDHLLETAVRTVAEVLGTEFADVMAFQPATGEFRLCNGVGWGPQTMGSVVRGNNRLLAHTALVSEQPVSGDGPGATGAEPAPHVREYGIASSVLTTIPGTHGPFGVLGVHTREPRRFNEEDRVFLRAVANLLGLAVRRSDAEDFLRASREDLRSLSHQLLEAQETERARIARELHDQVGQVLSAVKLNLEAVAQMSRGRRVQSAVRDGIGVVETAIRQVRTLSYTLRPALLDDLGLTAAVASYADETARRGGVDLDLDVREPARSVPRVIEVACYRILQEALTNALRHGQPASVAVRLNAANGELRLEVRDDGSGFNPQEVLEGVRTDAALGLLGMRERAELVGGVVRIESSAGCGTTVKARLPLDADGA